MRTMMLVAAAALMMTSLPYAAAAPRESTRPSDSQVLDPQPLQSQDRMKAPVGHRQPRPSDLPPSVLRAEEGGGGTQGQGEGGRTREREDINKDLQICKGC